jgi:hypothetical protein
MTVVPVQSVPLKERYYRYRDYVLHQKTSAAIFDALYWELRGTPSGSRAAPLLVDLKQIDFAALDTWYDIIPATIYNLPREDTEQSLVQIAISLHFVWTAGTGEGLCDWSSDMQSHFRRTYHKVVNRTDDSSVCGVDLIFWCICQGATPSVQIQGRQVSGPLGLSVVGDDTAAWPALASKALFVDGGPIS